MDSGRPEDANELTPCNVKKENMTNFETVMRRIAKFATKFTNSTNSFRFPAANFGKR